MRTRLTSRLSLLFLTFAAALIVFPAMAFAEVASPDGTTATSSPTITSDKDDYAPGELVTLSGSNWQAGESVHINVDDDQTKTWNRDVDVTADANGNISDSFNLPDWFVATYKVTATGDRSGTVTYSFTDANPSDIVLTPKNSSNIMTRGQSATYDVLVQMGGSNAQCTTTLSASGLPTGTNATFSNNPRTGNTNYTSTMTVTTTGTGPESGRTPLGISKFTVTMTRGSDCQGSGNISKEAALLVDPRPASNLQVTNKTQTSVTLSWTASPDAAAISHYIITYGLRGSNVAPDKIATSYTITGLDAGTEYHFSIRAYYLASGTNYLSAPVSVNATTDPADSTAPTTTPSATVPDGDDAGTDPDPYSSGSWTNKNVTLSLSAQDNSGGSGVKEIRYTTNGTEPTKTTGTVYTGPIAVSSTTTVKYLAVDNAGNAEAVKSFEIKIDKKNPSTTADAGTYNGGWTNQSVTVTLDANDDASGVKTTEYNINGGAFQSYPSGGITLSADGSSRIHYRSIDNAGNQEPYQFFDVLIDKGAPRFSCEQPDGNWHADNVTLDCTASDAYSGLANAGDSNFSLSTSVAAGDETANASTGSKTLTDAAGNTVTAGPIAGNKIDRKAPEVLPADVTNTTWRNSSLSQNFTSSDGGSGLASGQNLGANGSFTLTAALESANATTPTEVSKEVKDAVGNTTTRKVSALIDLTNPNISASVVNQPAPSGWYNLSTGGPQVDFECSDALSGIQSCPADRTLTDEGSNVGYSGTAYDVAGNSKSVSGSGLKVDLTEPNVAGAPDLLDSSDSGDSTDNLTNVRTPTFDVSAEAGSTVKLYAKHNGVETLLGQATATGGVARITSGTSLDDGTYDVYGKVTDQAGNVSSTNGIQITIVTIDGTAPDAPGLDMAAASDTGVSDSDDKTNNDKPTFSGNAEPGSTLKLYDGASLIYSVQVGAGGNWSFTPATALSEGTHQIKATATDAADNTSSESVLSVVIDKTAPGVSPGNVNDTTWRNTALSQAFTASDGGSGLAPNQGLDANDGFTLTASAQSANASSPTVVSKTVSDVAGNTTTRSVSALIDTTAPTLSPSVSPNPVVLNGSATASAGASDALSGINTQGCGPVDTSTPGAKSVNCSATDKAGNTATGSAQYSVGFKFVGFSTPVDNNNILNTAKAGQAIPLKWQLLDANNVPVTNLAGVTVSVANYTCGLSTTTDLLEEYAAGSSGLQNLGGGYYQFNWKSPTSYANSCKTLHLNLGEGKDANGNTITRTALFRFTK